MNKVIHINLAGTPFSIDEDAYCKLDDYLASLDLHFKKSDGYRDIIGDIEYRIAELLQNKIISRQIVSMEHVNQVISVMGSPEDFGAEWAKAENSHQTSHEWGIKTGKRLFRDPEDRKVSGVCCGLSTYFGIDDPVWIRLAFVLAALAGFGIVVYIVMWAIVPEAKTSADRLAMSGEPINIQNIARKIEDGLDHLSDKINKMGERHQYGKKKPKY